MWITRLLKIELFFRYVKTIKPLVIFTCLYYIVAV
jgi:hypothetical protein